MPISSNDDDDDDDGGDEEVALQGRAVCDGTTHPRFLWGRQNLKDDLAFRQPGHEASDEEAQDTAEPRAPTDDDEHVRECEDERQRWGA